MSHQPEPVIPQIFVPEDIFLVVLEKNLLSEWGVADKVE